MMKLRNIFGVLALSAVSLMNVSCSDDIMDRINKDEAHPGQDVVTAKFQLPNAIVSSVFTTNTGNFAWYVASYTEQILGTGNNQAKNAELRSINEIAASSTFDNEWNGTYMNLNSIQQMIDKCNDGGNSGGQIDIKAMGEILAAYNWGIMTDLFGDIPCSEAFKVSAPKLDKQEDIYNHIFELLDDAIANLNVAISSNMNNAGNYDLLFAGDLDDWRCLAHALKARYLLHEVGRVSDKDAQYQKVLDEAMQAVAFEGANLDIFDGESQTDAWSTYFVDRGYSASSKTVDDLMVARNDPREPIYNFNGNGYFEKPAELGLMAPGDETAAKATNNTNFPVWLLNGSNGIKIPSHLFSISELYFIIAEMRQRLGKDPKLFFRSGVAASMRDYATAGNTEITDEDVDAYLDNIDAKFAVNPLNEILVQKYIAQTRDEQLETYNDIRRCRYVDGSYPVAMTNPKNTQANANRWPLRLPYGASDVLSNPNVKAASGDGMYIFTDNVWWAGGNR